MAPRVASLASVSLPLMSGASVLLVVTTGDVANTGASAEYTHAKKFYEELNASLLSQIPGVDVLYLFVPGNHDLDFSQTDSGRTSLLEQFEASGSLRSIWANPALFKIAVQPQENYFIFCEELSGILPRFYSVGREAPIVAVKEKVGEKMLGIFLMNTSWCSKVREKQGTLTLPSLADYSADIENCDLVVALGHHPQPWIYAEDLRDVRRAFSSCVDVLLTGHEHDPDANFNRSLVDGGNWMSVDGACLHQPNDHQRSQFSVLVVDDLKSEIRRQVYSWQRRMYVEVDGGTVDAFSVNSKRRTVPTLTAEWRSHLRDVGRQLPFSAGRPVRLEEIFVWPRFRILTEGLDGKSEMNGISTVSKRGVLFYLFQDRSGRTAYGKQLYARLLDVGRIPILLDLENCETPEDETSLWNLLESALVRQYSNVSPAVFREAGRDRRALVFDNSHRGAGGEHIHALMEMAAQVSDVVHFLGGPLELADFVVSPSYSAVLEKGIDVTILHPLEFGYRSRASLISKWQNAYEGDKMDDKTLARREQQVCDVLGSEFVASSAEFTLMILSAEQEPKGGHERRHLLGHLHNAMVVECLLAAFSDDELDECLAYLTHLARHLYESGVSSIARADLVQFEKDYESKQCVDVRHYNMVDNLVASRILAVEHGSFRFCYRQTFQLFLGRALAKDRAWPDSLGHVRSLAVSVSRNADAGPVILFACYYSDDSAIITDVVEEICRDCLDGVEPFDFHLDTDVRGDAPVDIPGPEEDRARIRASYRGDDEESPVLIGSYEPVPIGRDVCEVSELDEGERVATVLQLTPVLGNVLRSQGGMASGDEKKQRLLDVVEVHLGALGVWDDLIVEAATKLYDLVKTVHHRIHGRDIGPQDIVVARLRTVMLTALLRSGAEHVGARHLRPVYTALGENSNYAARLLGAVVAMEQEDEFPLDRLEKLMRDAPNEFASGVLRQLVVTHFILYKMDRALRHRVAEKFGIPMLRSPPRGELRRS